jgi:hypothetical protein
VYPYAPPVLHRDGRFTAYGFDKGAVKCDGSGLASPAGGPGYATCGETTKGDLTSAFAENHVAVLEARCFVGAVAELDAVCLQHMQRRLGQRTPSLEKANYDDHQEDDQ